MRDAAGNVIGDTATNNPGKGLFSANGFSKFYMIHSGIARMYYRVYTDQHGWSPWAASKEITPYNEDGAKVQAIQIRVKGMAHRYNDVYYKVMLNDGTVLDWAKNGQTTGTMGSDRYIVGIRVGFWHNTEHFPYASKNLMVGKYEGAYRDGTGVHYSSHSGTPYTGWGFLDNVQHYFIDGEPARGWHYVDGYKYYFNNDGSVVTDLETIMGPQASYQINYNQGTRTMYIMAKDGDNGYIIPYKTFNSTSGPDTPMGNYKIYAKYDVKYMHDDVPAAIYCKYLNRFYNGFIIHSILYYSAKLELDAITFNYIDECGFRRLPPPAHRLLLLGLQELRQTAPWSTSTTIRGTRDRLRRMQSRFRFRATRSGIRPTRAPARQLRHSRQRHSLSSRRQLRLRQVR